LVYNTKEREVKKIVQLSNIYKKMKKANYYYLLRRGFLNGGIGSVVKDFITRVEADGGTVEAVICLNQSVAALDV
jgi:hypothetical protein|tara:strand:+ start:48 stop:272 length:225 start_codon:yes stop_codon:yes gene_type:complete